AHTLKSFSLRGLCGACNPAVWRVAYRGREVLPGLLEERFRRSGGPSTKGVVMIVAPPEQGQLVNVRQRRWVVTDVARGALPPAPLRGRVPAAERLVALASVEDDCLGEELQVVWELEVAARVHEKVALPEPTGFDPPGRLDAFLDAVRWGAASTADIHSIQ